MFPQIGILLVAMAALSSARTVPANAASLIESLNAVVNLLPIGMAPSVDNTASAAGAKSPEVYIPGRSNICDALCPKWCQKINGTTTDKTNCHYLCGNICFDKKSSVNPFVGNARYEVVPSDFEFSRYDQNGDKQISVEEFAMAEGVPMDEVLDLFLFADMNGDGFIDTQEFNGGPLVFTVQMAAELSAMALTDTEITTAASPTKA